MEDMQIIAGTPKTVIPRLKRILEETRPSIMALWANDGAVSHQDSMTCIRLLAQEVLPSLREFGDRLGLKSPFECDAPVGIGYSTDLKKAAAE
jgi:hypothetical protein